MPAFVVANVNSCDPVRYERYKMLAQAAVTSFGGRYVARGGELKVLEGTYVPKRVVILEFPSLERALEWWNSEEYAEAKALRQELSDTDMFVVDGLSEPT